MGPCIRGVPIGDKGGVTAGDDCLECESSAVEDDANTSDGADHSSESESGSVVGLSGADQHGDDVDVAP